MDNHKHKYFLYICAASLDRLQPLYVNVRIKTAWEKTVIADSRTGAVRKCLPEIARLIATITDPTIKYVSVYCGLRYSVTGSAERLHPIQIDVATKDIRVI